ncbi:transmembrane protein 252 [Dipodomys spectabilis]|uniref:transmembrane protein 252 n=1 Tax=Dipodomys spectabilis TaxID=105255 RepID=UPI001C5411B6|nr:transmembrane protein 252 [Dipodomys spectabilis]
MQNRAGLILSALALLTGFLMICLGAFFISADSLIHCQRTLIMAYLLLPLGFVILLSGVFWSTYCQASNNKGMFSHMLRQYLGRGDLPLDTVDRPHFYPPAYEESLDAEKQIHLAEGQALDVPPPLYTETGLELEDGSDAGPEAPPPYHESVVDVRGC